MFSASRLALAQLHAIREYRKLSDQPLNVASGGFDLLETEDARSDADRVFVLEADLNEIPATIDQTNAINRTARWAMQFIALILLISAEASFECPPTRFWLIAFNDLDGRRKALCGCASCQRSLQTSQQLSK
jgi:hypothetical protein